MRVVACLLLVTLAVPSRAQIGPATVIATYTIGVEGGSQSLSGRAVKLKADAVIPVGGLAVVATVVFDRRRDSRGSDAPEDDYSASFLTVGAGVGIGL